MSNHENNEANNSIELSFTADGEKLVNEIAKRVLKALELPKAQNNFPFVPIKEGSKLLSVDIKTLYNWEKRGVLKIYRLEGKSFINISEIEDYMGSNQKKEE